MGKILATTDFSVDSKAGLRFAIQLASQNKSEITCLHVYNIVSPTSWTDSKIAAYELEEEKKIQERLSFYIARIYKRMGVVAKHPVCVIKSSAFPEAAIQQYADENAFDFICISTRGAGKFEKFLGTTTSNLINQSAVPVIAVPYNHRTQKVEKILYASDLIHLQKELQKVVAFAKPLNAKLELLHFTTPAETIADSTILEAAVKQFSDYNITLNIRQVDYVKTMVDYLKVAIKNSRPSLLIMFTEQHRSFFDKLFLPSLSADYSFNGKIPLLVYNKS